MTEGDKSWEKCAQIIESLNTQTDVALIDQEFNGESCDMKLTTTHKGAKEFEFSCNEEHKLSGD